MATVLDKQLKRAIAVDGVDYVLAVDPEGLKLTGKGKRTPEVALRWRELLSGEAAMAVALNASLAQRRPVAQPQDEPPAKQAPATTKRSAKAR